MFPKQQLLAPKAMFMYGYTTLLQNFNDRAINVFERILTEYKGNPTEQDAFYLKGMALSFKKEYVSCREHMEEYLKLYADSGLKYEAEAEFIEVKYLLKSYLGVQAIAESPQYNPLIKVSIKNGRISLLMRLNS